MISDILDEFSQTLRTSIFVCPVFSSPRNHIVNGQTTLALEDTVKPLNNNDNFRNYSRNSTTRYKQRKKTIY